MNEHYYVTLPSNTPTKLGESNHAGEYRIYLPTPLQFDKYENWEVGLSEISIPKTFHNINSSNDWLHFGLFTEGEIIEQRIHLKHGYYNSAEDVVKEMQLSIPFFDQKQSKIFNYYKKSGHIELRLLPHQLLYINRRLAHLLGFDNDKICTGTYIKNAAFKSGQYGDVELAQEIEVKNKKAQDKYLRLGEPEIKILNNAYAYFYDSDILASNKEVQTEKTSVMKAQNLPKAEYSTAPRRSIEGKFRANVNSAQELVFVYTSIMERTLVGNIESPLIRIVPMKSELEFGETSTTIFNIIHYHNINAKEANFIDIKLTNENGDVYKFAYGTVIATLHFRTKQK